MTTAIEATLPRDAAEYLETETDVMETIARSRGMGEIAKTAGLARGSLHKAIGEGANPPLSTLLSVVDALNVTLSVKPKQPLEQGDKMIADPRNNLIEIGTYRQPTRVLGALADV